MLSSSVGRLGRAVRQQEEVPVGLLFAKPLVPSDVQVSSCRLRNLPSVLSCLKVTYPVTSEL